MNVRREADAQEAYAIGLLQQLAAMCDETRRTASSDPTRINMMLESFEETLATLAPTLERMGNSPKASRDAVLAAAQHASNCHQGLMDAMSLELERLGRAIAESDQGANANAAYSNASRSAPRLAFETQG